MFKGTENFPWLLYWMCERMNIFWKKYNNLPSPWSEDEIFKEYKFCNVYRVLDRCSQYLLKNVIYNGKQYEPEDMFFRILLFKHFNLPATWELLIKEFGDITLETGFRAIADFIDRYVARGGKVYSNAYIVNCCFFQYEKYAYIKNMSKARAHLTIWERELFNPGLFYDFLESKSLEELFQHFRNFDIYGDFTAQQYAIDMNYSPLFNFDENDFVITGPGSIRGLKRMLVFDERNPPYVDAIKWVHANLEELLADFKETTGMEFKPLPGRMPTLIDIQNCFCEIDKYCRGANISDGTVKVKGVKIKNKYVVTKDKISYMFPPKWGINI